VGEQALDRGSGASPNVLPGSAQPRQRRQKRGWPEQVGRHREVATSRGPSPRAALPGFALQRRQRLTEYSTPAAAAGSTPARLAHGPVTIGPVDATAEPQRQARPEQGGDME